jgi:hypothetical protein
MAIKLIDGKVLLVGGLVSTRCCGEPCSVTITCASLTAEPTLVGWSAYTNPNAGPIYKWKSRTLSGSFEDKVTPGSPSTECALASQGVFSGTATRDETGLTASANLHYIDYQEYGPIPCVIDSEADYPVVDMRNANPPWTTVIAGTCPGSPVGEIYYQFTSQTTCTVTRCGGSPSSGSGTETLGDPDTVEAAIARATPTAGTSCCAVTGLIDSTSVEDTTPISVGESTSVTLTINLTGEPSTSYDIELTFKNYIDSDDTPLTDTTETITITTDGAGLAEIEYDIPQPGEDRRTCYHSWRHVPSP